MDKIDSLILNYKLIGSYDYRFKKTIQEIIERKLKVKINPSNILINNNRINLKINPKLKTLIKLKEKEIVKELEQVFSNQKTNNKLV